MEIKNAIQKRWNPPRYFSGNKKSAIQKVEPAALFFLETKNAIQKGAACRDIWYITNSPKKFLQKIPTKKIPSKKKAPTKLQAAWSRLFNIPKRKKI